MVNEEDEKEKLAEAEKATAEQKAKAEAEAKEKEVAREAGKRLADLERAELEKIRDEAKVINAETKANLAKIAEFNKAAATRGSGVAAGDPKDETADQKWAREAKVRYAGTGMDPTPDEPKKK